AFLNDELERIGANEAEIDRVTDAFIRMSAAGQQAKSRTEALGDLSTSFGAAGSVASIFGGGAGTEALRAGGDIFGFLEYFDRLKAGARTLGESITGAQNVFGTFARGVQGLAPNLSASTA